MRITILFLIKAAALAQLIAMDLNTFSKEIQELRQQQGHWSPTGGSWNEQTDSKRGRKYELMELLREYLGAEGSEMSMVLKVLGTPDEVILGNMDHEDAFKEASKMARFENVEPEKYDGFNAIATGTGTGMMPGPVIPTSESSSEDGKVAILKYWWRFKSAYLWFAVDLDTKLVLTSAWFTALL